MKHARIQNKITCKVFLLNNADTLIFGGIIAVGVLIGALFSGQVSPWVSPLLLSEPEPIFSCLGRCLGRLAGYLFLLFFCGTSAMGFLSPILLLHYGLSAGVTIGSVAAVEHGYPFYLLCGIPFYLVSAVLLLHTEITSFPLSFRFFRLSNGAISADLPMQARKFVCQCLLSLAAIAMFCLLFSLYQKGIGSLLVNGG